MTRLSRALAGAALALVSVTGLVAAPAAFAADGADFEAGFLISDELFFDGDAMTAAEIDAFIDSKNPGCATGRTCLENYRESITAKSSTSRCAAISAASNQTAGQIIAKVALACDISPRAILVMLQKEQGLVTATAPASWAFAYAMGAGCPDTPTGCSTPNQGLYEQVYYGSSLLQSYTQPSNSNYSRYAAGQTSQILWQALNVKNCGSGPVYVQNQATHALYVYTPYQPNQAALDNLYGLGDDCSSYGNRNFWRQYTDWFGSTRLSGAAEIEASYQALNGANGWLGAELGPIEEVVSRSWGTGAQQSYENGMLIWSPASGVKPVSGDMLTAYRDLDGAEGMLGFPASGEFVSSALGGGVRQNFSNGAIFDSTAGGLVVVYGGFYEAYNSLGGVTAGLGWPISDRYRDESGYLSQDFQRGTIVFFGSSWIVIPTELLDGVADAGGVGELGWSASATATTQSDGTIRMDFRRGYIVSGEDGDAHAVYGGFASAAPGFSWLGDVSSDRYRHESGYLAQDFDGGTLLHSGVDAMAIPAALTDDVAAFGGLSKTGWGATVAFSGSTVSGRFPKALFADTNGTSFVAYGGFLSAYSSMSSKMGLPVENRYRDSSTGLYVQAFQKGTVFHTGRDWVLVGDRLDDAYLANGAQLGSWGSPTTTVRSYSAVQYQFFQGAVMAYWRSEDVMAVAEGGFYTAFLETGGSAGSLGLPTSPRYRDEETGRLAQDFQRGTVLHSGSSYSVRPVS